MLGNQLVLSSLGKAVSPALSIPQLPGVLWLGLRPHGLFLVPISMSIVPVLLMFEWSCGETVWIYLLTFQGDTTLEQTLSVPYSKMFPEPWATL